MDQITDYTSLQAAVAGTIHRDDDTDITDNVPLWIQLCEADLNYRMLLKDSESEESLTLTLGNNYVAVPTGYVSPIEFWLVIDDVRSKLAQATAQELPYTATNGIPRYWAIDGVNIRFDCQADDAYTAKFRMMKKSNLSVSNTSNYLLLSRPDVYLFGTLKQAALFTKDDADLPKWSALYEQAIAQMAAAETRARIMVPLRTELVGSGNSYNIYNE